mgnify:CR=1 FL=1
MTGGWVTLIVTVVEVTPVPVARSVVVCPAVTPVTAAGTEVWPAGTVIGEATVATFGVRGGEREREAVARRRRPDRSP